MAGGIDFILGKIDEGMADITKHYGDVKDADALPDDLLYAIRNLVQDCQSALDWTASEIHKRYVANPGKWSPYFPIASDHDKFAKAIDAWLPDNRTTHADVAAAMERHQPYQAGNEVLGHLHQLSRVNKHQQFSAQRLELTDSVHPWVAAGGSFETIPVHYGPMFDSDGVPVPGKVSPTPIIASITNIDWRFTDPDVSVLPTLESLAGAVRDAVLDVRATAGIHEAEERPLRVTHPRGVLRAGLGGGIGSSGPTGDRTAPSSGSG